MNELWNDPGGIIAFVLGVILGFAAKVMGYRVARRELIMARNLHCPSCQSRLSVEERIPIVSFVLFGDRCRQCKRAMKLQYPTLELACGVLFAATWLQIHEWSQMVVWCVFWLLLMMVTVGDLTSMRVPNPLSYGGALVITVLVIVCGMHSVTYTLVGVATALGTLLLLYLISRGRLGMGDVKLYMSIGAILGAGGALGSLFFASLSGTAVGLVLRMSGLQERAEYMPFVPHILVGVVVTVYFGSTLGHWYLTDVVGLSL